MGSGSRGDWTISRFFANSGIDAKNSCITLTGDNAAHITGALRKRPGDKIIVCDGARTDYICEIEGIERGAMVSARIIESRRNDNEPPYDITLFQAIPKGDKFDDIARMCVELGVTKIAPLITERVITKTVRADRLSSICEAAAKQSGRGVIPKILNTFDISGCVELSRTAGLRLCPWEEETSVTLKEALKTPLSGICVVIGPEGGLSAKEVNQLRAGGFITVSLGGRILRTQTAGAAVLAMINYAMGL